ncbi:MAG: YfhO family protein [Ruminococcus sp.]|nr:YfhO family protein [Ruminococcus sp.]
MAKTKSVSSAPSYAKYPVKPPEYVKFRFAYIIASFLIPALLTLIAYALFGVYPFGERSVLTLDLNGQYVYYFENIRDAFWSGRNPLYSWARNLSGGYQGVIGYYLASPFTFIVILLPRKMIVESLMIMQLCKVGACGASFCVYAQKAKNVKPIPSVLFATMYALMAFVAIQLIDPMWVDGPIFLPLIILGLEYLVDDGRKINYIIPLAIMFIANFYIGFMVAIFVAIYFVYYLFFGTKRKFDLTGYAKVIGRMFLATGVVLLCSYIMIMPVYKALALGKFDFSEPDYSLRTMFNPLELIATVLPNQYYSVNVDEGTRMYGRPEIYCGVLSFILVPLYFFNKNIKRNRKIGYGLVLFILFFSMWIKPFNMMWHGGQDPNWLPYRYSFLVSFVLVSMAAESFSNLEGYKMKIGLPAGVFSVFAVLVFIFESIIPSLNYNEERYQYPAKMPYTTTETINGESVKHLWLGTLTFGLVLAAIYLCFLYIYSNAKKKSSRNYIAIAMAVFVLFEAGYNTYDTILKIDKEVYYSSKKSYAAIMDAPNVAKQLKEYDDGFYRTEKTFFRNVNDNQAYGFKGLSHSSSVMNTRIINFIETLGYSTKSYETRYDGNTPLADSLLGIKYVLNDPARNNADGKSLLSPYYNQVYTSTYQNDNGEASLEVYENPDALPIGFMANSDILKLSFLGNDNPFNSMNNFLSAMTGNTPDYSGVLEPKAYFKRIDENPEIELNECWESNYNGQHCYNANAGAADPTVRIHVTSQSDDALYMFLKSDNPKKCNMWVGVKDPADGIYKGRHTGTEAFDGYGQYYDGYDYSIVNLGSFAPGTEIEIRLTILQQDKTGNNEYVMVKDFQFYHLDYNAFHEDIEQLKQSPWNLDLSKTKDDYLVGEVDAKAGQILYTSIPYEPGWTIKVDGKKVEERFEDIINDAGTSVMVNDTDGKDGEVVILNALIGLRLPEGHHTVSMKYSPPGFRTGCVFLVFGIAAIVLLFIYDRKNNMIMIQERELAEMRKKGITPPAEDKSVPVAQIIKSKGAITEKPLKQEKQEDSDDDEKPEEAPDEVSEAVDETVEAAEEPQKENTSKPQPKNNNRPKNGGNKKKKKK